MKSVKLEYFSGIILNPKETIDKILKEKCGWKDILLVLIILALITTGFSILDILMGPISTKLEMLILMGIFKLPISLIYSFILILLFYIFTYLVGCRGKFKEFASVVSFILIIPIVGLGVLGILMNTLLSEEMVALASGTMTLISLYTTNPLAIMLYLTRFLIYAYLVYVIHLAIINIYRISKKKALIAASSVCDKIRNEDRKLRCYRRVKRVVGEN